MHPQTRKSNGSLFSSTRLSVMEVRFTKAQSIMGEILPNASKTHLSFFSLSTLSLSLSKKTKRWEKWVFSKCIITSQNQTSFSGSPQIPPAAVAALLASQGMGKLGGKWSGKQSPVTCSASSSNPMKKSSSTAVSENPSSSSSSSSTKSLLCTLVLCCTSSSSAEVAGEEHAGLAEGFTASAEEVVVAAAGGVTGFWRVLPAREFLWVGIGWLCSAV